MPEINNSELAPVVLFVYNRPAHTLKTLQALMNNELADQSHLIIYSDGPKDTDEATEQDKVKEVRKIIRDAAWCKTVEIIESARNTGLAASVISGVTQVVNKYGKAIVLEDDLVTSPYFLSFMNDSLNLYEHENEVISISGYFYPIKGIKEETFFIKGADCWGWATWKRGWDFFNADGKLLKDQLVERGLQKDFDFNSTFPFFEMLEYQLKGLNNSWAIRWYASAFLNNKLTLYPATSLIQNIGHDNSGQHSNATNAYTTQIQEKKIRLVKIAVSEEKANRQKISTYFFRMRLKEQLLRKTKSGFKKIGKLIGIQPVK